MFYRAAAMLCAAALFLCAPAASAGDVAELEILGFSDDASIFAFEEFGIQDGSGFPYANRYYIDVENDSFLPGSPFRVLIRDETVSLDTARAQVKAAAQAIVGDEELARNKGLLAGYNPVTELSGDPDRMVINPRPVLPPIDAAVAFHLEEIGIAAPERCAAFGPVVGYRLSRVDLEPGGTFVRLHQDEAIPQSRGCPFGYQLGAVQTVYPQGGPPSFAVMIAVRGLGFEGPDIRWLAVTGRL
jgi:predicted secreted protein